MLDSALIGSNKTSSVTLHHENVGGNETNRDNNNNYGLHQGFDYEPSPPSTRAELTKQWQLQRPPGYDDCDSYNWTQLKVKDHCYSHSWQTQGNRIWWQDQGHSAKQSHQSRILSFCDTHSKGSRQRISSLIGQASTSWRDWKSIGTFQW